MSSDPRIQVVIDATVAVADIDIGRTPQSDEDYAVAILRALDAYHATQGRQATLDLASLGGEV